MDDFDGITIGFYVFCTRCENIIGPAEEGDSSAQVEYCPNCEKKTPQIITLTVVGPDKPTLMSALEEIEKSMPEVLEMLNRKFKRDSSLVEKEEESFDVTGSISIVADDE